MASIRFRDVAAAQRMKQQVLQPAGGTQPMTSIWNPSTRPLKAAVDVPGEQSSSSISGLACKITEDTSMCSGVSMLHADPCSC